MRFKALSFSVFMLVNSSVMAGVYNNHYVTYYNTEKEALDACKAGEVPPAIPARCVDVPQYGYQTTYDCHPYSEVFSSGVRDYPLVVQSYYKPNTLCGYAGTNYYNFAYPTTACAPGTQFTGPDGTDCLSQTFVDTTASSEKQIGSSEKSCKAGNPCDMATGNKFQEETDFVGGDGVPSFVRFYNSYSLGNIGLGVGWSHNHAKRIAIIASGAKVRVINDAGQAEVFNYVGNAWVGDADTKLRVTASPGSTFTVSRQDGSSESYDWTSGLITSSKDRLGRNTTYTYNASGLISGVTGPYGHSITFTWATSPNRISKITLPSGKTVQYVYSGNNLISATNPLNKTRQYLYNQTGFAHLLTGIKDENGVTFATFAYNSDGKAVSTEHNGGVEHWDFAYGPSATAATFGGSSFFTANFDTNLGIRRLTSKIWTADNTTVTQTWSASNNLLSRTNELNRTTAYAWDSLNRLVSITDPAGRLTSFAYNGSTALPASISSPSVANGQTKVVSLQYDSTNHPTQISQAGFSPSGGAVSRTVGITWTANGQIATVTDPRNNTTTFEYWTTAGGQSGQIKKITNALAHVTTFDSYNANGLLTQETAPNGVVTTYTYDDAGRLTGVTNTAGGLTQTTSYTYDPTGLLASASLPAGVTLTYAYDNAHRLTSVTDNAGNKAIYGYDSKSNPTLQEVRDASNSLVRQAQQTFDARNRLASINAGGSITQMVYDYASQITQVTDPNNHATSLQYDLVGRLTQQVNSLNGVTGMVYDANDAVTGVTAPNAANTTYAVDDLGNRLTESSQDRGVTTYTYDAAGNVLTKTDARGTTATLAYDSLNRITSVSFPQPGENVTYSYDSCQIGKLCNVTDASGAWAYSYDALGRIAGSSWTVQGQTYTTSYTWTLDNKIASITYPGGRVVSFTRNPLRQISGITTGGQNIVTARTYRADGLLTGQTYGNGLVDTRAYDLQGRLTSWTTGTLDSRTYGYDANGNITSINANSYGYDWLDRITSEPLQGFAYDPNGNRLQDGAGNYTYGTASNRMAVSPAGTIAIDTAGNTTAIGTKTFTYNQSGRLVTALDNGVQAGQYGYSFDGHRAFKTTASGTTLFHYAIDGNLIAETDSNGNLQKEYVWDDDGRPLATITAGVITYLHPDHLGTPRFGTSNAQSMVWQWYERPFGQGPLVGSVTVNLRYPGQYFDAETGLHQNWNRTYDPASGRYLESDPVGLAAGLNTYAYVGANPISRGDPLGLEWQLTVGVGGFLGGNPILGLPGLFGGGGLSVGFTSSGQVIVQAQATGSVGVGVFGGVGVQGQVSRTRCPTKPGLSVGQAIQGDANFGAGPSVGGSVQNDGDGGGSFSTGVGKAGVGFGVQASVGTTQTVTIATPALFPDTSTCGCQ